MTRTSHLTAVATEIAPSTVGTSEVGLAEVVVSVQVHDGAVRVRVRASVVAV